MLFFKNIIALKNFDTTVKCHFGRISDTKMFFIRKNHIFTPDFIFRITSLALLSVQPVSGKTSLKTGKWSLRHRSGSWWKQ